MKKRLCRAISMLLAAVLIFGQLPAGILHVHAAEVESESTGLEGKTISILGASISTYTGISNNADYNSTIGKNAVYYTTGRYGVYADDTWWMQAANDLGLRLLVNNSWSGSSLLYERSGTVGAYVDRCVQLHNNDGEEPDIIGIQMGTNDFQYYKDTLGTADIDYAALIKENADGTYTYATPVTSLEAAAIVLHKISVRYPNAEVYYLNISQRVDDTDELIRSFNAELKQVVEHFGAHIVDIYGSAITMENFDTYIGDGRVHPNKLGMDAYTEAFKRALIENTAYAVDTHTVSMNLDGVTADYGDDKIVVDGDSFTVNLTATDSLQVTVTMGGKDITASAYADGTVTIDAVTDDVTITAKSVRIPHNYRWEFNGTDLASTDGSNPLTKTAGTTTDGVFSKTSYSLSAPVVLLHDQPWVVEWKCAGTFLNTNGSSGARIFTSDDVNAHYNARYIFKSNTNGIIAMGEKDTAGSHNYGIALADYGIDWTALHTYRLENRIAADGSNMVYLYVDGAEIGPMNHYYVGTTDKNTTSDWLSGKDFTFPYMGTDTHGFTNCSIDYIQVTECAHNYKNGICTACGEEDPDGLPLNGLNVLCLGDSITYGQGLTTATRWSNVLASKYGWTLTNQSQGGISLSSYYYTSNGQTDISIAKKAEILKTMTTPPDVIIVWGGHNDTSYRASPLGTWEDNTTDSFKGALKHIAELAEQYAPDATLFVLTPLWNNEKPSTLKIPENTTDTNWMFVDAIYEGAEKYDWIPINMDLCGITPYTKSGLLLDNIHPNAAGTEKIVEYLSEELANYGQNSKKETLIFNQSSVSIKPGESTTLKAVLSPRSGIGSPAFTWSSSDTSVATVDSNGVITAVSPGNAIITATADGTSASISVSVQGCDHTYTNGICTICGEECAAISLRYDDHYDVTGKTVEIMDAGTPTSYKVGYGVAEGTLDDAVITLEGNYLVATGIGTAQVRIDGILYEITVTAAPISLILLAGQSNMQGSEGNADQSIVCPEGMVYATYGDRYTMTTSNATNFAPSALTGAGSALNVNGTTTNLKDWPIYLLNEAGAGKAGPDSGFAYEWVKQTGEKVWIVNAAHGGSSITTWQDGGANYEEALLLFSACQETLRQEIAAGHYTLSHMGYFWCQGCTDYSKTAEWYVDKYLTMHENFKTELAFDHDGDPATADKVFEFAGIIPVRAGNESYTSYRQGTYVDTTTAKYYESFKDLRFTGPRVAQYWMINNPDLPDIWGVCNIGEDWVWMPDGTNGVTEYFQAHYPNGTVDYTTQVAQKTSWYTPTTPADVHDSIHYNQIGYNEVGRESVRNALIMLGEIEAPEVETTVKFLGWDGYTEVTEITAATAGASGTLVVPIVYPLWEAKTVTYELSEGLTYEYYDLLADIDLSGEISFDDYYRGKKYLAVGDSITYGSLADPREEYRYSTVLAELLGANEKNVGTSSATLSDCRTYGKPFEFTKFTYENLKGASLVTIFLGTNDFNYAVKDGIWQGNEKLPAEGYEQIDVCELGEPGSNDTTTIYGAMEMWCKEIQQFREMEEFADTRFFFVTPLESAWNNSVSSQKTYDTEKQNIHGYTLRDLCNVIIEVAGKYDIPVIDLNKISGIYWNSENDETCSKYLASDKLHPNNYGHALIANVLYEEILKDVMETNGKVGKLSAYNKGGELLGSVDVIKPEPGAHYADHLSQLPENVCSGLNLWNELEHDKYYYANGTGWGIHSSGTVYSVTIPVNPGDLIYATSFGKAGSNGHASTSGIRITYFSEYGVAKTMAPAEVYAEFSANGYLTVPEGAVAINIAMWSNSDDNEIYILNRPHDTTSDSCAICGGDSHTHSFTEWETVTAPSVDGPGEEQRTCSCGEVETREVEGVWQTLNLSEHMTPMPEEYCAGTNLWAALEHDPEFFSPGTEWHVHSSGTVYSVTIPVSAGDKIFATSFGKGGTNGGSSNGIRVTFFDAYGVAKTYAPADTYAAFTANGGYLIAPEGAVAVNIPMWTNADSHEIYILNRPHTPGDPVVENEGPHGSHDVVTCCSVCGKELSRQHDDGYLPGDINGDGAVNNKDVTRLFQYLSDYDVEVVEEALDVNGDGSVNNKDLTRLFQYLSDYDVEIH